MWWWYRSWDAGRDGKKTRAKEEDGWISARDAAHHRASEQHPGESGRVKVGKMQGMGWEGDGRTTGRGRERDNEGEMGEKAEDGRIKMEDKI